MMIKYDYVAAVSVRAWEVDVLHVQSKLTIVS